MRMIWKVIGSIIVLVIVTSASIIITRRQKKERKRLDAAYELLKNDALDYAMRNPGSEKYRMDQKLMVQLKSKRLDLDVVFNPEKKIMVGREKDNMLCIQNSGVSAYHCEILIDKGQLLIQDLGSSNGTMLVRKFNKYNLQSGEVGILKNKDWVYVAGIGFQVFTFQLNKSYFRKQKR